jgi:hypothetical protein
LELIACLVAKKPGLRLIVHWAKMERGGHFAAWEAPTLFAEEVAGFFDRWRRAVICWLRQYWMTPATGTSRNGQKRSIPLCWISCAQ